MVKTDDDSPPIAGSSVLEVEGAPPSPGTAKKTDGVAAAAAVAVGESTSAAAPSVPEAPSVPPAAATTTAKPRRKKSEKPDVTPLFAFHDLSLAQTLEVASSGRRPKRKLKAITRFDPQGRSSAMSAKIGEGFQCPRCSFVCSYDSRVCAGCGLECYYEAGVGVVTLKERRVSVDGRGPKVDKHDKPPKEKKPPKPRVKKAPAPKVAGEGEAAVPKRRGRPPKNPPKASDGEMASAPSSAPAKPKGRVGRPRGSGRPVGRPKGSGKRRGRPRKNPLPEQDAPIYSTPDLNSAHVEEDIWSRAARDVASDYFGVVVQSEGVEVVLGSEQTRQNEGEIVSEGGKEPKVTAHSQPQPEPEVKVDEDLASMASKITAPMAVIAKGRSTKAGTNNSSVGLATPNNQDGLKVGGDSLDNASSSPMKLAAPDKTSEANSQSISGGISLQSAPDEATLQTDPKEKPKESTSQSVPKEKPEEATMANVPNKAASQTISGGITLQSAPKEDRAPQPATEKATSQPGKADESTNAATSQPSQGAAAVVQVVSELAFCAPPKELTSQPAPKDNSGAKEGATAQSFPKETTVKAGDSAPKEKIPQPLVTDGLSSGETKQQAPDEAKAALRNGDRAGKKRTREGSLARSTSSESASTASTARTVDESGSDSSEGEEDECIVNAIVDAMTLGSARRSAVSRSGEEDAANDTVEAMLNISLGATEPRSGSFKRPKSPKLEDGGGNATSAARGGVPGEAPEKDATVIAHSGAGAGAVKPALSDDSALKSDQLLTKVADSAAVGTRVDRGSKRETPEKTPENRPPSPEHTQPKFGGNDSSLNNATTMGSGDDSPLARQLRDLQAKYEALASSSKLAEQENAVRISKLESALQNKEQEATCASATMFSLKGRIASLQESLDAVAAERDELSRRVADDPLRSNLHNNPEANDNPSMPHHLSPMVQAPEDVSNCSSENNMEDLQSKMEEVMGERDSAEAQVKELLGVQLQKDELLLRLQEALRKLRDSEERRREEREEYEEEKRTASEDADGQRKRIIRLESLCEVMVGQRERLQSRVRVLLLEATSNAIAKGHQGGNGNRMQKQNSTLSSDGDDDSSAYDHRRQHIQYMDRVENVLSTFKVENEALAEELKETKSELGMVRAKNMDARKHSNDLEHTIIELNDEIDSLKVQYNKLQDQCNATSTFEASFPSDQDITDRLEESLARSLSLNEHLGERPSSEKEEARDILAPSPQPHVHDPSPPEEEEAGGLSPPPAPEEEEESVASTSSAAAAANASESPKKSSGQSLNVPSLADAQAEDDNEHPMEELTNALDSLNEFETFLMDLDGTF